MAATAPESSRSCPRPPAFLSCRQRAMRGNRTAIPDLCRGDRWIPSNASSKTSSGFTDVHRAELLERVAPDERVHLADLLVGQARVRLGERHQLAVVPDAERVVGEQAGAPAVAGLGVDQDGVHRVRVDLPLPPVAAPPPDAIGRAAAASASSLRRLRSRDSSRSARQLLPRCRRRPPARAPAPLCRRRDRFQTAPAATPAAARARPRRPCSSRS